MTEIYSELEDQDTLIKWKDGIGKLGEFAIVYQIDAPNYSEYDIETIYYFKDSDLYVKFEGSYSSYSSYYYNKCVEVKPEQVEVTKYVEVN